MATNPKRCKQCIHAHRQCDRIRPECSRCKDLRLKCTYKESINIKIVQKVGDVNIKSRGNIILDLRLSKPIKCQFFDALSHELYALVKKYFPKPKPRLFGRYQIESYMAGLQYPSIIESIQPICLLLGSLAPINHQVNCISKQQFLLQIHIPCQYTLQKLLLSSIKNYFRYFNSVIPLFEETNFDFFCRPLLLRYAILVCGLIWMDRDPNVEYLISYIDTRLKEMLSPLHRLSPTLANVQALLILVLGFKTSPTIFESAYLLEVFAYQFSTVLGLHLASINSNNLRERESAMVYTCLNTLYLAESLCFGSRVILPTRLSRLSSEFKDQVQSDKSNDRNQIKHINNSLIYYYSELNLIIYQIRLLKERYLTPDHVIKKLNELNNTILFKLDYLKDKYFNLFFNLTTTDIHRNLTESPFQHYICFIHHYLTYFTLTLKLYHPLHPTKLTPKPLRIRAKVIELALDHASQGIEYGTRLSLSMILPLGFYFLGELASFIFRFQKFARTSQPLDSLKKLQSYFFRLRQLPYLSLQAKICITFILSTLDQLLPLIRY